MDLFRSANLSHKYGGAILLINVNVRSASLYSRCSLIVNHPSVPIVSLGAIATTPL